MSIQQHMDNAHHGGTPERSTAPQHNTTTGEQQWCRTRELLWWCSGAPVGHHWGSHWANRYGTGTELVWNRDEKGQGRTQVRQHRGATAVQNTGAAVVVQWGTSGAPVGHQWCSRGEEPVRNLYRTGVES